VNERVQLSVESQSLSDDKVQCKENPLMGKRAQQLRNFGKELHNPFQELFQK
jgi:hypothetical protein